MHIFDYEYDYEHEHEHEHEYEHEQWRLGQILLNQINPTQVIDAQSHFGR